MALAVEDVRLLASLSGAAVTAASLLFTIWSYRRSQDQQLFSRFRPDFANLNADITRLDHFISEVEGHELADNIAREILAIFPTEAVAREKLAAFGATTEERNALTNAIYSGWHRSRVPREVREIVRALKTFPSAYRGRFPVLMSLVDAVLFYLVRTTEGITSPDLIIEFFKREPSRTEALQMVVRDATNVPLQSELSIVVSGLPITFIQQFGQRVFDLAQEILAIVEQAVGAKADSLLSNFSRRERRIARPGLKSFDETIDDIFYLIKFTRRYFSGKQWSRLQNLLAELNTTLDDLGKGNAKGLAPPLTVAEKE